MKYFFTLFFCAFTFFCSYSQDKGVFNGELQNQWSGNKVIKTFFKKYTVFKMDAAPIRDYLNASTGSQHLHVSIGADMAWDLEMEAHDIRSPLYSERVWTDGREMQLAKRENITFRGREVSGGGRAALTIDDDFLYGFIRKGDAEFFIEPLTYVLKDAPADLFILYEASDAIQNEVFTCGVEETQQKTEAIKHDLEDQNRVLDNCYVLQLAIASDYLMYQGYMNSTTNVGNHNIAVMNNVQTNYTDDFADDIEFQIVTQFYSTTSNEPWPNSTDIEVILYDFADWAQGGGFGTTHDLGQFWSRRDYNGASVGLAFVGVVCTSGFKYHVLQDFTSNASQLRCMTSHEIGHNFNASHDADNSTHIMAPYVSSSNTWSTASQSSINAHIANRASWGNCFTFCSTPPTGASPTAQFVGSPVSGCAPLSVQFTDQSAGAPTSWSWSFPGGTPSTSTSQNPTVLYNTGGTYSVTLTATNAMGSDQEVKSNYISVTGMPVANFTTFTAGSNAVFTNTSTNATSYFWEFGDGATSTQTNPTHFYAASGTYSVTLTASNNCGSDMEIKNVNIVLPPIADFFANVTQGCAPLMVQFTDQSSNNPTSWSWTLPGGAPTSSTQQNPSVVYNFPGTFNVTLTAMNSAGQDIMTITGYITVQAPPNAGFNSNTAALTANFTNTSTNATSYLWNFGDGFTSSAVNPAHTYATGGTYAVTLTATGPCGSDIQVNNVVIQGPPDPAFSANVTNGCAPLTVQFTDISTGNPTSWEWLFPGGNPASSILQNPVVTYNTPGSYSVTMTATNASGDSTAIASNFITVSNITANAGADQSICTGQTATLTASGGGTYLWSNNLGSNATVTTPALSQTTTYTVTVTNGNCTATDQVTVNVGIVNANAGADQSICTGQTATLTASGGGTYLWSNNLGSNATVTTPALSQTTTYTVTVTNGNCTATDQVTVNVGIVNANAGADQSICIGQTATLTASGGGTYLWSNNLGSNATVTTPALSQTTTYTVTVTNGNCTATDQVTVNVGIVNANAGADQSICTGQTATLTASGGGSYLWSNNLGSNATVTTPALSQTTTYTVTVTNGNCTATDQVTVNIGIVNANAGTDQSICTGQTATLTASGGGSYLWSNNLGSNATVTTPALSQTTTYTVTVTNGNCTATDQVTVNVGAITANAGADQSICTGQTATLTASGGGSYLWSNNLGSNATVTTPALTQTTTYTVTVTNGNCTATDQVTVNVGAITANAGADQSICTDQTATLTASGGGSYLWSNNLGTNATVTTPALSQTTTYTVTVTNGNCTATDQVTVNVGAITANAGADQSICTGQTATLTASGGGSYLWSNNLGSNATVTTPALTQTTTYTVTVTNGNCTATDQVTVNVGAITANAGADQSICTGQTATLTASGGGSYLWSNNLGSNATVTTPALTQTTTYTVTVTNGNCTATDQVTVNVGAITANAGADQSICTGQTATLTASGGGSYLWSNNLGTNATVTTPALTQTTTYTVTVTNGNCTATDQVTVNVGIVNANAGADQSICTGQTATLTASGGGSYLWSNNLGTNATVTTPALSQTTTYTVTVTMGNCTATDEVTVNVGAITANAGADQNICTGQTATLTASGGGSYLWSNNLGSNATVTTPALTQTTTYTVTVTNGNCTATDQVTVNVGAITANAGADQSICTGQTATLTASGGGSYLWSNNLGTNATVTTPALSQTTTYTVTVTMGNCTATDEVTVNVGAITANAGADQSICTGQTATLTASGGGSYLWSNNLGTNATVTTPALSQTTTYTVTVTMGNCTATDQITVNVGAITANAGADQSICTGQTATLTASGGGSYLWSNNLGTNATVTTPSLTQTTTYTVTVTMGNCTATDEVTVNVGAITANAGADQSICTGQTATLTASGGDSYLWSNNLGSNATVTTPALSQTTTYTVTVTNGNCTATDEVTVNVGAITANAGADQSICTGQTATLTASGGGSYLWSNNLGTNATVTTPALSQTTTYTVTVTMGNCTATDQVTITLLPLPAASFTSNISGAEVSFTNTSSNATDFDWDFGDGNFSIESSPGHTYENNDVYTVSLIATNECGADTAYETVEIIIINTNDLSGQIIFGLYPNPNNGHFTMVLSGNSAQAVTYKMTNVLGQVLDEQLLNLNGGNLTKDFDYPNIVAGSYFITLSTGGKSVFKKIIVF